MKQKSDQRREVAVVAFLILAIAATAILALQHSGSRAGQIGGLVLGPCDYSGSGDWTISTSCTKTGESIAVDGALDITSTGSLTLNGGSISVANGLNIDNGGLFSMEGGQAAFNTLSGPAVSLAPGSTFVASNSPGSINITGNVTGNGSLSWVNDTVHLNVSFDGDFGVDLSNATITISNTSVTNGDANATANYFFKAHNSSVNIDDSEFQFVGFETFDPSEGSLSIASSTAANVTRNTFHNLKATGLRLANLAGANVSNNNITTPSSIADGMLFDTLNSSTIAHNFINSTSIGLLVGVGAGNIIESNEVHCAIGVCIEEIVSDHETIRNNTLIAAALGSGITLVFTSNSQVLQNNASGGFSGISVGVESPIVTNNTIANNTVDSSLVGIDFESSEASLVSNNNVTNTTTGISVLISDNNTITSNRINNSSGTGVSISFSPSNLFANNNIQNATTALSATSSPFNNYTANIANLTSGNGFALTSSNNSLLQNNNATLIGSDGILLTDSNDSKLENNKLSSITGSGIHLAASNNPTVSNNNITNTSGNGIFLFTLDNAAIQNNNLESNSFGIHLSSATNSVIQNNTVRFPSTLGIALFSGSDNNRIANNTVQNASNAIHLFSALNNTVQGNNVTSSTTGINVAGGSHNTSITNNRVNLSSTGIAISSSNDTVLQNNNITSNGFGITLDPSTGNFTSNFVCSNTQDLNCTASIETDLGGNTCTTNNGCTVACTLCPLAPSPPVIEAFGGGSSGTQIIITATPTPTPSISPEIASPTPSATPTATPTAAATTSPTPTATPTPSPTTKPTLTPAAIPVTGAAQPLGLGLACMKNEDCPTKLCDVATGACACSTSKCVSNTQCCTGYCSQNGYCTAAPTALGIYQTRPACAGLISVVTNYGLFQLCEFLWLVLVALSLFAAWLSRKEPDEERKKRRKWLPLALFLLPILVGLFSLAIIGILVAIIEIAGVLVEQRVLRRAEEKPAASSARRKRAK